MSVCRGSQVSQCGSSCRSHSVHLCGAGANQASDLFIVSSFHEQKRERKVRKEFWFRLWLLVLPGFPAWMYKPSSVKNALSADFVAALPCSLSYSLRMPVLSFSQRSWWLLLSDSQGSNLGISYPGIWKVMWAACFWNNSHVVGAPIAGNLET